VRASQVEPAPGNPTVAERDDRRPALVGRISFIPRWLGRVADIGHGIAIIVVVLHWAVGVR
jgi:hypothetical protein